MIVFDYVEHDSTTPKNRSPSIVSEMGDQTLQPDEQKAFSKDTCVIRFRSEAVVNDGEEPVLSTEDESQGKEGSER